MNTRNWKFVKDGLDDFRDGLPPPHHDIVLEVNILFSATMNISYLLLIARERARTYTVIGKSSY
jgi:hypothetical protein